MEIQQRDPTEMQQRSNRDPTEISIGSLLESQTKAITHWKPQCAIAHGSNSVTKKTIITNSQLGSRWDNFIYILPIVLPIVWPIVLPCISQGCASCRVLGRAGLGGWLGLKCYLAWGGAIGNTIGNSIKKLSQRDPNQELVIIVFLVTELDPSAIGHYGLQCVIALAWNSGLELGLGWVDHTQHCFFFCW